MNIYTKTDNKHQSSGLLKNIAVIRPILVVLLVFYHAFAPYSGAWSPIEGYPEVPVYWWLDKLSYAFMLETFVFISGYVFGYQVRTKGESKLNAKILFIGKFKRLILPSMFFSVLYILFFQDITQPIYKTMYEIVNGVAHMWFLPMLFLCFVCIWIIEKLHIKQRLAFLILVLCSIFSIVELPLQLGNTMYYMLFFYLGYALQRNDILINQCKKLSAPNAVALLSLLFIVLFPLLTLLNEKVDMIGDSQIVIKIGGALVKRISQIIYSFVGVVMFFSIVNYVTKDNNKNLSLWVLKIGNLCMGVYLLQQFILKGMYNYTDLPSALCCYYLPWFGFFVTLLGSLLSSYLLNLSKCGRFILGG